MPADVAADRLTADLAGLDALELAAAQRPPRWRAAWSAAWPKGAALVAAIVVWQLVVWSHWKPEYLLPGPRAVWDELLDEARRGVILPAVALTMRRAVQGYAAALVVGVLLAAVVAQSKVLRSALGSFITGLQTMPTVAWLPLAFVLFKGTEASILFVVVLGAAPSIANGLLAGIDDIPQIQRRAGRVLGASGWTMFRYVTLPAALPGFVAGMKQGWAFAWRSLMAGELIVIIPGNTSIGVLMQNARDQLDTPALIASMVVVLVIGLAVDALFFSGLERSIRRRRGLLPQA